MRIKFLIVSVVMFCSVLAQGQKTQAYDEMETLWATAKGLYDKGMYVPAQKLFTQVLLHDRITSYNVCYTKLLR